MDDRETLELARSLVRINSVNPKLVPGAPGEIEIASFVNSFLEDRGIETEMVEVEPDRPNVVGRLPGGDDGPSLLLCCHMDTVSVEGMNNPFQARVEDGKLYGRGAHDIKSGLAAVLAAASELAEGSSQGGEIIVAAVIDEEFASAGTEALVQTVQADAAIVFEPSDLMVLVAHKGFAWFHIQTDGKAAHGSRPEEAIDAIAHMGRVLVGIEDLDRKLRGISPHPRLGTPSIHPSLIKGGRELSSYADRCELDVERRTLPGETDTDAVNELEALLDRLGQEDPNFKAECKLTFSRPPYEISTSHGLPQAVARAIERATGRSVEFGGLTAWTDSAILADAAIPSVVFGPGGAGLHSLNEYAEVQDIYDCRDVLVELAQEYCRRGG